MSRKPSQRANVGTPVSRTRWSELGEFVTLIRVFKKQYVAIRVNNSAGKGSVTPVRRVRQVRRW